MIASQESQANRLMPALQTYPQRPPHPSTHPKGSPNEPSWALLSLATQVTFDAPASVTFTHPPNGESPDCNPLVPFQTFEEGIPCRESHIRGSLFPFVFIQLESRSLVLITLAFYPSCFLLEIPTQCLVGRGDIY